MTDGWLARNLNWLLAAVLLACVARTWIMPLTSSFWVDEMVTVFVVRNGPDHPSLADAPQVPKSIYYSLAAGADALFGVSELGYRLPSLLLLGVALFLIARLAARLVHPNAAWFAVFACLSLRGFNYEAADARPYALGTCVAAASLLFLIRWLDSAGWMDVLLFLVSAALIWRAHLIFWPFYLVLVSYAAVRIFRKQTPVGWLRAGGVFGLLGVSLVPVLVDALALGREAASHVIVSLPSLGELGRALKLNLVAHVAPAAWLLTRRFQRPEPPYSAISVVPALGWWLIHPLSLYAYSYLTGNSVFVPRYLSLSLPGCALAATAAAAWCIPPGRWKRYSLILGVVVLVSIGGQGGLVPSHHNSDWKRAFAAVSSLHLPPDTPVVCPSPFIEARPPAWRPDYPLPGFLYAHLGVYPLHGKPYLLPFESNPEALQYAASLTRGVFQTSGRFVILGGDMNVRYWRDMFSWQPELSGWSYRQLGPFGDVDAMLFERGKPEPR
jgi:hypothetical protein